MLVKRNAALGFIFITILVDVIGLGVIIPVIPSLIEQLIGRGLSDASKYGGWLIFSYAIMQLLFSPVLGGLSDKYGRRPVLLLSLFGLGLDYIFHAFAPDIFWLFIGRIIAGVSGASFTTATAYIADISEPEKKAQNFGLVGAAFGLGFIIGPVIGGVASQWGIRVPFFIAAGLTLFNVLYGYLILPESLLPENRREFEWKRANPIGSLMHLKKYPIVSGLVVSIFLLHIAAHAVQSTWSYFTMLRFDWDAIWVGYSMGFVGLLVALVQGLLIRVAIPKLGQKNAVYAGMVLWCLGLAFFAFASRGWMMFAFLVPYCLGGIAGPALQGIISDQVSPTEQGELQGALTGLISLTSIIGPIIMTNLFAYYSEPTAVVYFPGAPFLAGAILVIVSIFFSVRSLKNYSLLAKSKITISHEVNSSINEKYITQ